MAAVNYLLKILRKSFVTGAAVFMVTTTISMGIQNNTTRRKGGEKVLRSSNFLLLFISGRPMLQETWRK